MKKKKGLRIFLIVLGAFAAIIAGLVIFMYVGLDLEAASIKDVDISQAPDGVYTGELTGSRFANTLEVTVSGGRITDIRIVKDMTAATKNVSDKLFAEVIDKQSLQVDAVSGATASSNAYLKSLEDALGR